MKESFDRLSLWTQFKNFIFSFNFWHLGQYISNPNFSVWVVWKCCRSDISILVRSKGYVRHYYWHVQMSSQFKRKCRITTFFRHWHWHRKLTEFKATAWFARIWFFFLCLGETTGHARRSSSIVANNRQFLELSQYFLWRFGFIKTNSIFFLHTMTNAIRMTIL